MTRRLLWIAGIGFLIWLAWTGIEVFGRSQQQQVLDATHAFLDAVERRDWEEVRGTMTEDYGDEFGQNRELAVENGRQALRPFFTVALERELVHQVVADGLSSVQMKLTLIGNGAGYTPMVISRANQLREPWVFHWHKRGPWPWSWKIVQIHQPELGSMATF